LHGPGVSTWASMQSVHGEFLTGHASSRDKHQKSLHQQESEYDVALRSQLVRLQHQNASLEVRQVQADKALEQAEIALEEDAEAVERRLRKGKEEEAASAEETETQFWDCAERRRRTALSQVTKARKILHLGEGE